MSHPVTLAIPDQAFNYYPGCKITVVGHTSRRKRAWRWFKRVILRIKPPPPVMYTVTEIDYDEGVMTVNAGVGQ